MGLSAQRVRAEPLTEAGWAPFGWIPVPDTDRRDGTNRLAFDWDDVHVNLISHNLDEVAAIPGGLRCDEFFRHDTHTQVLMPLDSDAVIAVGPAAVDFSDAAHPDQVRAFVVHRLEPLVLHRGTWHWGPFPIGTPRVTLFNVQGFRYADDNATVDLAARGMSVDILTS